MSLQNTSHDGNTYPVHGQIRPRAFEFRSKNEILLTHNQQQPASLPPYRQAKAEAAKLERQWHRQPGD